MEQAETSDVEGMESGLGPLAAAVAAAAHRLEAGTLVDLAPLRAALAAAALDGHAASGALLVLKDELARLIAAAEAGRDRAGRQIRALERHALAEAAYAGRGGRP
jgi:hypothetical protein